MADMARWFNIGGPWDEKISSADIEQDGKTIHLVRC